MKKITRIRKNGNSYMITLNPRLLRAANLQFNEAVSIEVVSGNSFLIKSADWKKIAEEKETVVFDEI